MFIKKLASDIQNYKLEAATRFFTRKGWNEDDKYAYNKTIFEKYGLKVPEDTAAPKKK